METADFLIIGAGIVGVTVAREIRQRQPSARLVVLEKESAPGLHASGRNSGVLHSGIYYPPDSLKARVCAQGAAEMAAFHERHGLPLDRRGKVLIPTEEGQGGQLDLLAERAALNGVEAERLDAGRLREIEPATRSATGEALFIRSTAVGSPDAVMRTLLAEIREQGVELRCNAEITNVSAGERSVRLADGTVIQYGHAVNAAGLHADRVAHWFGVGRRYTMLPFKGLYWQLDPAVGIQVRHLIYPVPDLRVPFLGIHTTTGTDGSVYLGPTAVPAWSRENYRGLKGINRRDLLPILRLLTSQVAANRNGFRNLAWQEGRRYFKPFFLRAARRLLPQLQSRHLLPAPAKTGIRAQLLDRETGSLVTDFLVERGPHSTHILNAISPAWTCSFPFARFIADEYLAI